MPEKLLLLINGVAGAGKTTTLKLIEKNLEVPYRILRKYTTRSKRKEEEEDYEFFFISKEQFLSQKVDFIFERMSIYYGFTKQMIETPLAHAEILVCTNGEKLIKAVKEEYSKKFLIITVLVDARKELIKERILKQNLANHQIENRLKRLEKTTLNRENYDIILQNNLTITDLEHLILKEIIDKMKGMWT